jgi:hypothetical protein
MGSGRNNLRRHDVRFMALGFHALSLFAHPTGTGCGGGQPVRIAAIVLRVLHAIGGSFEISSTSRWYAPKMRSESRMAQRMKCINRVSFSGVRLFPVGSSPNKLREIVWQPRGRGLDVHQGSQLCRAVITGGDFACPVFVSVAI